MYAECVSQRRIYAHRTLLWLPVSYYPQFVGPWMEVALAVPSALGMPHITQPVYRYFATHTHQGEQEHMLDEWESNGHMGLLDMMFFISWLVILSSSQQHRSTHGVTACTAVSKWCMSAS